MKFLIVEDSSLMASAIKHILLMASHDVEVVGTLEEAMQRIQATTPDLILLDLSLPGSPPERTLEAIKEIKTLSPDSHVAVMTGYAGYDKKALASGADAFRQKGELLKGKNELIAFAVQALKHGNRTNEQYIKLLEDVLIREPSAVL